MIMCLDVKGEKWLVLAVKEGGKSILKGGPVLPLPVSGNLLACEGNLSFVAFHLFFSIIFLILSLKLNFPSSLELLPVTKEKMRKPSLSVSA